MYSPYGTPLGRHIGGYIPYGTPLGRHIGSYTLWYTLRVVYMPPSYLRWYTQGGVYALLLPMVVYPGSVYIPYYALPGIPWCILLLCTPGYTDTCVLRL